MPQQSTTCIAVNRKSTALDVVKGLLSKGKGEEGWTLSTMGTDNEITILRGEQKLDELMGGDIQLFFGPNLGITQKILGCMPCHPSKEYRGLVYDDLVDFDEKSSSDDDRDNHHDRHEEEDHAHSGDISDEDLHESRGAKKPARR